MYSWDSFSELISKDQNKHKSYTLIYITNARLNTNWILFIKLQTI